MFKQFLFVFNLRVSKFIQQRFKIYIYTIPTEHDAFIFATIQSTNPECIFPVSRAHRGGVDSIKVDRTFVMFPSFRMLSQSFYQWADHRDRERGSERERVYSRQEKCFCNRVCGWVMDQELITQACPLPILDQKTHTLYFVRDLLCFLFPATTTAHINNLLSFVCDFPERGGGERLGKL